MAFLYFYNKLFLFPLHHNLWLDFEKLVYKFFLALRGDEHASRAAVAYIETIERCRRRTQGIIRFLDFANRRDVYFLFIQKSKTNFKLFTFNGIRGVVE